MPRYALAGLTIVSNVALPELLEARRPAPEWAFEVTKSSSGLSLGRFATAVHEANNDDGTVWLAIRRAGDRYLLRFPGSADFVVTPAERRVDCVPVEGVAERTMRHLLLDQVVPHLLAMDGSLVLHASAIAIARGVLAFVGPSGAGKSSLAASFACHGFPLVADDFVLLSEQASGFLATPSYPGLRLWPDSVDFFAEPAAALEPVADNSEKRRLVTGNLSETDDPLPLVAILILSGDPPKARVPLTLSRLPRREGFLALFEQAFRVERQGRKRQLAELDRFTRLVESTTLMRLAYHQEYGSLAQVRDGILRAVDTPDHPPG